MGMGIVWGACFPSSSSTPFLISFSIVSSSSSSFFLLISMEFPGVRGLQRPSPHAESATSHPLSINATSLVFSSRKALQWSSLDWLYWLSPYIRNISIVLFVHGWKMMMAPGSMPMEEAANWPMPVDSSDILLLFLLLGLGSRDEQNFRHAITIFQNWRYVILAHMSLTHVGLACNWLTDGISPILGKSSRMLTADWTNQNWNIAFTQTT